MKENKLVELSMDFSVDIINLVKFLKANHETIIANQIGRRAPQLAQTSTKRSMHKEQRILYLNLKLRSKKQAKQAIGSNCYIEQIILMNRPSKRCPQNVPLCELCSSHLVKP